MPSLKANTAAWITTIRPSAIRLIDWDGSIINKFIFYILYRKVKNWYTITKCCYVIKSKLILPIDNKAVIIPTLKLSGVEQMALDLHFLDKTISEFEILFTLRFYHWEGDWISLGYHQKSIPPHWEKLLDDGIIKIVRRPSGGGAVLHSGGITYALTFKKSSYKRFSYELVNNWLIENSYAFKYDGGKKKSWSEYLQSSD